jgi:hypothetical protein
MDPFILREKFQGARSSNLSSASLSGAILPGEGIEKAGKEATEGMKKLFDIARRRAQNQNVLDARKNTLKMTQQLTHAYSAFEVTSKPNSETGEFGDLLLKNGKPGTFDAVWSETASDIRDSYLTGDQRKDNTFLESSARMFQSFIINGTVDSIARSRNKLVNTLSQTIDEDVNQIYTFQDKKLVDNEGIPLGDGKIDMDEFLMDHSISTNEATQNVDELNTPEADKFNLKQVVKEKYTEGYIDVLLKRDLWESAEEFIEKGVSGYVGPNDPNQYSTSESPFYLSPSKLITIRDKIKRSQATLNGGENSQISLFTRNAVAKAKTGDTSGASASAAKALKLLEKKPPFFKDAFTAQMKAAENYNEVNTDLTTTPLSEHADKIDAFYEKNSGGLAGATVTAYRTQLRSESAALRKSFNKDGAAFVERYHPATRAAYKLYNEEIDPELQPIALQKAIKISLAEQNKYSPGNKADILTIPQIEEFNKVFNQKESESKKIGLDGFHDYVKKFFNDYGEYGGNVLNELKDPQEGREEASSVTKLKSEIAIASIYGNTRVFNLIIGSSKDAKALRNSENWNPGTLDDAKIQIRIGFQKFYKSMGYSKFSDFADSQMSYVATSYHLALARQKGTMDAADPDLIAETLKDLLHDKWSFYENVKGFAYTNSNIRYLSIPKNDNEGNAYAHEETSRALDHIRENPELLKNEVFKIPHMLVQFKDAGVFINNGDGSGFKLGVVNALGKVELISDTSYSWDKFNSVNYPKAFDYPETTGEIISKTIVGAINKARTPRQIDQPESVNEGRNTRDEKETADRLQKKASDARNLGVYEEKVSKAEALISKHASGNSLLFDVARLNFIDMKNAAKAGDNKKFDKAWKAFINEVREIENGK